MKTIFPIICLIFGSIYTINNCICLSQILKNNPENYKEKIFNRLTQFAIGGFLLGLGLGWVFDIF